MFFIDQPMNSAPKVLSRPFSETELNAQTNALLRESRANLLMPQAFPAATSIFDTQDSSGRDDANPHHEHDGSGRPNHDDDPGEPAPVHNPDGSVTTTRYGVITTRYPDGRVVEIIPSPSGRGSTRTETFPDGRQTKLTVGDDGEYSLVETNADQSGARVTKHADGSVEKAIYAAGGACIYRSYMGTNGVGWEEKPGPDGKPVRTPVYSS